MDVAEDRACLVEVLRGLMAQLTSPDLTLDEANQLRPRLMELLATLGDVETARSAYDGPPHRISSTSVAHSESPGAGNIERGSLVHGPAESRSQRASINLCILRS